MAHNTDNVLYMMRSLHCMSHWLLTTQTVHCAWWGAYTMVRSLHCGLQHSASCMVRSLHRRVHWLLTTQCMVRSLHCGLQHSALCMVRSLHRRDHWLLTTQCMVRSLHCGLQHSASCMVRSLHCRVHWLLTTQCMVRSLHCGLQHSALCMVRSLHRRDHWLLTTQCMVRSLHCCSLMAHNTDSASGMVRSYTTWLFCDLLQNRWKSWQDQQQFRFLKYWYEHLPQKASPTRLQPTRPPISCENMSYILQMELERSCCGRQVHLVHLPCG